MINSLLVMAEKTPPTTGLLIFVLYTVVLVIGFIILVREIRERARLERLVLNQLSTLAENGTRIDNLLDELKRSDAQAEDFKDKWSRVYQKHQHTCKEADKLSLELAKASVDRDHWLKSYRDVIDGDKSLKNYMAKLAEIEKYVHNLEASQDRIATQKLKRNFMDIIMGEFEDSQHEDS